MVTRVAVVTIVALQANNDSNHSNHSNKKTTTMSKKYQPINCNFYDELELLAVRQKTCKIIYHNEQAEVLERMDIIVDFKIKDHAEYMLLKSGESIRLDRLVSADGVRTANY